MGLWYFCVVADGWVREEVKEGVRKDSMSMGLS